MSGKLYPSQNILYRRLRAARDFIQEHYDEALDLATIAREARVSPFYLHRAFRDTFDETPHAYLTRIRLERARALLKTSDRPVTAICLDVGFSSLGSFSTLFARYEGASPSAYRRKVKRFWQVEMDLVRAVVPYCFAENFVGAWAG